MTAVYDSSDSKNTYFAMAAIGSYDKEIVLWMTWVVDEIKIDSTAPIPSVKAGAMQPCHRLKNMCRKNPRYISKHVQTAKVESIYLIFEPQFASFSLFFLNILHSKRNLRALCVLAMNIARGCDWLMCVTCAGLGTGPRCTGWLLGLG